MRVFSAIIDGCGIQMDQGKVHAIRNWLQPTSIKEFSVWKYIFYRKFIANFSLITSPLTLLLWKRPKSLSWNPAATEAFNQRKEAFCTAPILKHPNPDLPFKVELDANTVPGRAEYWHRQSWASHHQVSSRWREQNTSSSSSWIIVTWDISRLHTVLILAKPRRLSSSHVLKLLGPALQSCRDRDLSVKCDCPLNCLCSLLTYLTNQKIETYLWIKTCSVHLDVPPPVSWQKWRIRFNRIATIF